MPSDLIISNRELEKLNSFQKLSYFSTLKDFCISNSRKKKVNIFESLVTTIISKKRNYEYEFRGVENIPRDGKAIFICNHSNSHDILGAIEILQDVGLNPSVLVASDDLNFITNSLFASCNSVLIDRRNKQSTSKGIIELSTKVISGMPIVIFGEATWNLHPFLPMHQIKIGGATVAAITEEPVIPTIFEYVESPNLCLKEKELYIKCIVHFGTPINISRTESLISQTSVIQTSMEQLRLKIWQQLSKERYSLQDVDQTLYLNHTYLKKFKAFGFTYDSLAESRYLFSPDGQPIPNEFCLNEKGLFVPGITSYNEGKKYIKRI